VLPPEHTSAGPLSTALLTVEEIAAKLRVKPSWVYTHADQLGAFRLGKYLRFDWNRVQERLAADSASPSQSSRSVRQN